MAESSNPGVQPGAKVFTADGHAVGAVIEVLSQEFLTEEQGLFNHQLRSFLYEMIGQVSPDRVDLTIQSAVVSQHWNEITMTNVHQRNLHVVQVGRAPVLSVPLYDEAQTTTGGPPTGESEQEA